MIAPGFDYGRTRAVVADLNAQLRDNGIRDWEVSAKIDTYDGRLISLTLIPVAVKPQNTEWLAGARPSWDDGQEKAPSTEGVVKGVLKPRRQTGFGGSLWRGH